MATTTNTNPAAGKATTEYDTIRGYRIRVYGTELDADGNWYYLFRRVDTGEYNRVRCIDFARFTRVVKPATAVPVPKPQIIQQNLGL